MDRQAEIARLRAKFGIKMTDEVGMINVEDAVDGAISDVLGFCRRTEVIEPLISPIRDMATIRMNRVGAEGESARGEGGVSRSFIVNIPLSIRQQLISHRLGRARKIR